MTQPVPAEMRFIDPNNGLLGAATVTLETGTVTHPTEGTIGVVTLRSATTTFTGLAGADDIDKWGDILKGLAAQIRNGGIVVAGPADLMAMEQLKRNDRG